MLINSIPQELEDIELESFKQLWLMNRIYNQIIVYITNTDKVLDTLESKNLIHKINNNYYTPTMLGYVWYKHVGLEKYLKYQNT